MGKIIIFHEVIMGQLFANWFLKGLEMLLSDLSLSGGDTWLVIWDNYEHFFMVSALMGRF